MQRLELPRDEARASVAPRVRRAVLGRVRLELLGFREFLEPARARKVLETGRCLRVVDDSFGIHQHHAIVDRIARRSVCSPSTRW